MSWRLARSLEQLRNEVNAAAPRRSKRSDGSIGDAAHARTASDHNPNAAGVVCAVDLTHDPSAGADMHRIAEQIRKSGHPALKYIIWNRRIWSKARASEGWRYYGGSNPHSSHMHVSVGVGSDGRSTGPYDNTASWGVSSAPAPKPKPPQPGTKAPKFPLQSGHWFGPESSDRRNHSGYWAADRPGIRQIRDRLRARGWSVARGDRYDAKLAAVIRAFQKEKGLRADGLVGSATWPVLWTAPIT
jgi:hypothetical protein